MRLAYVIVASVGIGLVTASTGLPASAGVGLSLVATTFISILLSILEKGEDAT